MYVIVNSCDRHFMIHAGEKKEYEQILWMQR